MPPFQGQVTDAELNTLVEWLSTLGTGASVGGAAGAGTAPAPGGGAPPAPAPATGGGVTTPAATVLPGTSVPIGVPTAAPR
jgi:hypothetical protein